jgi:hypothetical protein
MGSLFRNRLEKELEEAYMMESHRIIVFFTHPKLTVIQALRKVLEVFYFT